MCCRDTAPTDDAEAYAGALEKKYYNYINYHGLTWAAEAGVDLGIPNACEIALKLMCGRWLSILAFHSQHEKWQFDKSN